MLTSRKEVSLQDLNNIVLECISEAWAVNARTYITIQNVKGRKYQTERHPFGVSVYAGSGPMVYGRGWKLVLPP